MTSKDIASINQLFTEAVYRDIETMQPGDQKFRPSVDRKHSTPEWDGITDPTKGPSMLTPSVDEEEVTPVEKIRKLIKQEIKRAPSKMTYAKRVLKKLLRACSSV